MNVSFDQMTAVQDGIRLRFVHSPLGCCCEYCQARCIERMMACSPGQRKDREHGYWEITG